MKVIHYFQACKLQWSHGWISKTCLTERDDSRNEASAELHYILNTKNIIVRFSYDLENPFTKWVIGLLKTSPHNSERNSKANNAFISINNRCSWKSTVCSRITSVPFPFIQQKNTLISLHLTPSSILFQIKQSLYHKTDLSPICSDVLLQYICTGKSLFISDHQANVLLLSGESQWIIGYNILYPPQKEQPSVIPSRLSSLHDHSYCVGYLKIWTNVYLGIFQEY